MKVLIADDEPLARQRLGRLLDDLSEPVRVVGEAANGTETLRLCERLQPHILLLDIAMPGMDGVEVARHLAELHCPPAVIFTTAYDHYALAAFETSAVSYLLKPVRRDQLWGAVQRARRLTRVQLAALNEAERPRARTQLCARRRGELELVPVASIVYFSADRKYVSAHHLTGELLLDESLKALEDEFGERFIRVHRNALVARRRITALVTDGQGRMRVRLKDANKTIEVSRRHLGAVRRLLRHGFENPQA